jgi:hypothetical protein
MVESEVDRLFEILEKNIKADNKDAIVDSCTRLLGYSNFLSEKTQVTLFLAKGITLLKLHHYTLALLNVKQALAICPENNDLGQKTLEYVKQRIME